MGGGLLHSMLRLFYKRIQVEEKGMDGWMVLLSVYTLFEWNNWD